MLNHYFSPQLAILPTPLNSHRTPLVCATGTPIRHVLFEINGDAGTVDTRGNERVDLRARKSDDGWNDVERCCRKKRE